MKRYDIRVDEIKSRTFTLSAKNKKEAIEMVKEVIYNTCILHMDIVDSEKKFDFNIKKSKIENK